MLDFGGERIDPAFVRRVLYTDKLRVAKSDPTMIQLWAMVANAEDQVEQIRFQHELTVAMCERLVAGDWPRCRQAEGLWTPS